MQDIVELQEFFCVSQVEHICFGEKLNGSGSDRCFVSKMGLEVIGPRNSCSALFFFQLFLVLSIARHLKRPSACEENHQSPLMLGFVSNKGLNSFWIP